VKIDNKFYGSLFSPIFADKETYYLNTYENLACSYISMSDQYDSKVTDLFGQLFQHLGEYLKKNSSKYDLSGFKIIKNLYLTIFKAKLSTRKFSFNILHTFFYNKSIYNIKIKMAMSKSLGRNLLSSNWIVVEF